MANPLYPFKSRFDQSKSRALLSGGAVFTYLATGKEIGGKFMLFEAKGIPGMEPPPHVHMNEDESFYILEGAFLFTFGDEEIRATAGDFVFLPRGIRHQFKVLSPHFRCLVSSYPAGLEDYFEPLTVPYTSDEIPPVNTAPPPPEALEMMQQLDAKFGITYFY
ncbi:MAG: cupin domain-containing protein [Saprospiraceae bacterium]|nr:cupin domain-containing protein [Saprospiraceae bacterium]